MKGIPKSVGIRIRRNCSTRYDDDTAFVESLREFKGYLITSGYAEKEVDESFGKLAHVKREQLLEDDYSKQRSKRRASKFRKHRFITDYEPAFTDIKRVLVKHQHLMMKSRKLRSIFPRGARDFQVAMRRDAKNLKERLAPSRVSLIRNTENGAHGSRPCGKNCCVCPMLEATKANHFSSAATKMTYKIRQDISCESKNVIYMIRCLKHNVQGVGYTTDLKSRIANYKNHHKKKIASCGISQHFQEDGHMFERDFRIQPIVTIMNPPSCKNKLKKRLEEFELYWQDNLITGEPQGMNKLVEMERARKKLKSSS